MPNTNFQTIHQMGSAISNVVKQASGRDPVQNIDMDFVTVAQNKTIGELSYTGNPVSFNTSRPVQIQRILLGMNPIQSGSGDPSPENVRPISGWTGVNVSRTGKNLWASDWTADGTVTYKENGVLVAKRTGGITILLGAVGDPIGKVLKAGTYTFSSSSETFSDIYALLSDGTEWRDGQTKTFMSDISINQINCSYQNVSTGTYYWQVQIELGSAVTTYEPYSGTTIPVTFPDPPGTVYQGTLDLISGQLTVTHLLQTFTGAESEDWINSYGSNGFRIASRGMKVALLNTGLCNWLPVLSEVGNAMGVALGMNDSDIYVRHITDNLEISDLTEWKAYLAEHPLEVFYPLEPAQYYQVTPQDLNTLAGDNVIVTDGDTLEVMYYQYGEV